MHEWLRELERAGFEICIVSNNWKSQVGAVAKKLNMPLVARAGKPRGKAFREGMKVLETNQSQTAVVGDQLFTDVLGGNRLGLITILVVPVGTKEMLHTRFLRYLERLIIKRIQERKMLIRT